MMEFWKTPFSRSFRSQNMRLSTSAWKTLKIQFSLTLYMGVCVGPKKCRTTASMSSIRRTHASKGQWSTGRIDKKLNCRSMTAQFSRTLSRCQNYDCIDETTYIYLFQSIFNYCVFYIAAMWLFHFNRKRLASFTLHTRLAPIRIARTMAASTERTVTLTTYRQDVEYLLRMYVTQ